MATASPPDHSATRSRAGWPLASLLTGWLLAGSAWASTAAWDTLTSPSFSHLTLERELPNGTTALAQDSSGLLWIGTQGGLVQWDGYRSRVFTHDPKDSHSLPGDFVRQLVVSRRGTLYLATNDRLARYDAAHERFVILPIPAAGTIDPLAVDSAEGLWIGTDEGLWTLPANAAAWQRVDPDDISTVRTLLPSSDGSLWVGSEHGLRMRAPTDARFLPVEGLSGSDKITALTQGSDGRVWIGTGDGRIYVGDGGRTVRPVPMPTSHTVVASIVELRADRMCVGLTGQGLVYLDAKNLRVVREVRADPARSDGLASDSIEVAMTDRDGGLWVAHDRGVDYARGGSDAFQTVASSAVRHAGFAGHNVTAVLPVDEHQVWIGSEKGADLMDPAMGRRRSLLREPAASMGALPNAWVSDFAAAGKRLWVGTRGLFEVDGVHVKRFAPLKDEAVYSLVSDGDTLWVGLKYHGLVRISLRDMNMTRYQLSTDSHSIPDDAVQAVLVDRPRGVWVATTGGLGLLDEDTGRFRRFVHSEADPTSVPNDGIDSLLLDAQHRLWIGTLGGGVAILLSADAERPRFHTLGRSQGLPDANADKLLADLQGRIWVSTDHGIAVIDPESLSIRGFGPSDGVSISSHWSNAGARMPDGTLVFGGNGGMTIVHPEQLPRPAVDPPLLVTAVKIGTRRVPPSSTITLGPQDRELQIEFAALDYAAPQKLEYAHQMIGIDDHWVTSDADHRFAAYTNLPPGRYPLLLKNSNRLGEWSRRQSNLTIIVAARWYQTAGFKAVALGLALLIMYGVVRGRTALLMKQRRELEARVAERTQELERAKEALEQLATEDGLTQIGNRRRFDSVLELEFRRAARNGDSLSLLLIDVDDFKAYNDTYGHQAGDEVLRQVAQLCKSTLNRASDVAARYGGEEFAVLLPQTELAGALNIARSINAAVAGARIEHRQARAAAYVTVSIGAAVSTEIEGGKEALVAAADGALYAAKHQGRNCAVAAQSQPHSQPRTVKLAS